MSIHGPGPTDDECANCPQCGEGHATLLTECETSLEHYCNRCMADLLVDRYSNRNQAVNAVKRAADRADDEEGR